MFALNIINDTFAGLSGLAKLEVLSLVKDLLLDSPSKPIVLAAGHAITLLLKSGLIDRDLFVGSCFEYTMQCLKTKDKGICQALEISLKIVFNVSKKKFCQIIFESIIIDF